MGFYEKYLAIPPKIRLCAATTVFACALYGNYKLAQMDKKEMLQAEKEH